ncbi:hypothetical protein SXCC_02258 [Gluconacetobacter sp. SXCC-1]|nr:hypothetical protein SXCC_02258 [Gluconacetobacter sp. SXCC-1]
MSLPRAGVVVIPFNLAYIRPRGDDKDSMGRGKAGQCYR